MNRAELASVLRMLADALDQLDRAGAPARVKAEPAASSPDAGQDVELLDQIRQAESREEAASILRDAKLTAARLEVLARSLDVPVRKGERKDAVIARIVNASIGYRLGSEAIRSGSDHE